MLTLRQATHNDLMIIAEGIQTALLMDNITTERTRVIAEEICSVPGVLYSPENTTIAELDGKAIGIVTAYDGAGYRTMRQKTMPLFEKHFNSSFPDMEDESEAGEYYIDSLAVLPDYRGKGIGRKLLSAAIEHGKASGLKVTLAVDPENEQAQRLYSSLGFTHDREIFIFGHTYWKWSCKVLHT